MTRSTLSGQAGEALAIVAVFAIAGPPVGAVAFLVLAAMIGFWRDVDLQGLAWIGALATIYAAPVSYAIGIGPALLAGLVIALRKSLVGTVGWVFALATGLGVGAGIVAFSSQPFFRRVDDRLVVHDGSVIVIATATLATLVCWLLVRLLPGRRRR